MREIVISSNESGRRLDRFLRKYLREAPLSDIYKLIRKDVKVNGKRRGQSYMLNEGDVLSLYVSDEVLDRLTGAGSSGGIASAVKRRAKKQFRIIFEDENILIADKPYGLLTHGDQHEKKNHLANQVRDYLIEKGDYDPSSERVFSPAPANRIDRNTTGIVLFGKTAQSLRDLGAMIREDMIDKYYLTIASGIVGTVGEEIMLTGSLAKDQDLNRVTVRQSADTSRSRKKRTAAEMPQESERSRSISAVEAGRHDESQRHDKIQIRDDAQRQDETQRHSDAQWRDIATVIRPLEVFAIDIPGSRPGNSYVTLVEVRLVTGRPHQIRAHLASIGHPVIGDTKYASQNGRPAAEVKRINGYMQSRFGLSTQLLHAYRLDFRDTTEGLGYLTGRSFEAPLPAGFERILSGLRG